MPAERAEVNDSNNTDEDPLLNGTNGGILAQVSRYMPRLSGFRSWRRSQSQQTRVSGEDARDIETGSGETAREAGGAEEVPGPSGRAVEGASASTDGADVILSQGGSLHSTGSRGSKDYGDSPTARQGLLGGLMRLGSTALPRGSNSSLSLQPTCLICLENLTSEDFESGEAISLECQCRGDMALRHRTCAEKWAHVKGNRICDICKSVVQNLPEVTPRAPDSATGTEAENAFVEHHGPHHFAGEQVPGGADVVFDCIRVTWVSMIICILFFETSLANALWTGLIVGILYTLFVRAMYRHQLTVMLREQQRELIDTPVNRAEQAGDAPLRSNINVV